jgi:hypothetical protein
MRSLFANPIFQVVRRFSQALAVVILGLVLSADAALAAPTKAQFIQQGDALCRQVQHDLVAVRRQAEAAKSLPESDKWVAVTRLWTRQIRIQGRFNVRFRALGVPEGDSTARALVAGLDRGLVLSRRVRDGFARRDTTALAKALPAYVRFTTALNRRVAAYGFNICGRS